MQDCHIIPQLALSWYCFLFKQNERDEKGDKNIFLLANTAPSFKEDSVSLPVYLS